MKKFVLMLLMVIGFTLTTNAQVMRFRTTAFAEAAVYNGTYVWGDWENSNMTLVINCNQDKIIIYSPRTQIYRVYGTYNNGNAYSDRDGGSNVKFYVYDQDGDRGEVRLRIQRDGTSQVYVDFLNCAFAYCVVRTN